MRTHITIAAFALLAACSSERQMTAPQTTAPATAANGDVNAIIAPAGIKPNSFSVFTVAGTVETVFGHPGNEGASSTAMCPFGSVVTGGGFDVSNGYKDVRITDSKPNAAGTGWVVFGAWYGDDFTGNNYATFNAVATCAK